MSGQEVMDIFLVVLSSPETIKTGLVLRSTWEAANGLVSAEIDNTMKIVAVGHPFGRIDFVGFETKAKAEEFRNRYVPSMA